MFYVLIQFMDVLLYSGLCVIWKWKAVRTENYLQAEVK